MRRGDAELGNKGLPNLLLGAEILSMTVFHGSENGAGARNIPRSTLPKLSLGRMTTILVSFFFVALFEFNNGSSVSLIRFVDFMP
jgi:hypothetical protein